MNLQQKVNELIERGKALKAANPELANMRFDIEGLQYNELVEAYPEKDLNKLSSNKMMILVYGDDMQICVALFTVPLKIKTIIEVIESENTDTTASESTKKRFVKQPA